ncbi:MAG TPA: AAA-like domain-containing protein [Fimbriimonadaceae bacterium]|jgi:class 3 adenylate cyclase
MIKEQRTEIAHVLFLDIVEYSKLSTSAQSKLIFELTGLVNSTETYQNARKLDHVLPIPTGDGMALLFFEDIVSPAQCAVELAPLLKANNMAIRMGIHSGLVRRQTDIAGNDNVVGEGINTAQRIMSFADDGHILISSQYADWLRQFDEWLPHIKPLGECETKHGEKLIVFSLCGEGFGRSDMPKAFCKPPEQVHRVPTSGLDVVLLYRRNTHPDDEVLGLIEKELSGRGLNVFVDRHLKIGVDWAKAIEQRIRSADAVVVMLSDAAAGSEMLEYELETAYDENRKSGKPQILPIRLGTDKKVEGSIGALVNAFNFKVWEGPQDNDRLVTDIVAALLNPTKPVDTQHLEPAGGAVSPDSPFYVARRTDAEFLSAICANESIILVKGPRQVGKTSLIGRGAKFVREASWRRAMTDFQKLSGQQLASEDAFYKVLAATLARQLKFHYDFAAEWIDIFGANMNMENFVRSLIEDSPDPLVWFMDEADKIFGVPYASDFFGLVRSWHNSRATEPGGPWDRFTIVIGYATEAHLFIQDLNQSPFNVGRQIKLSGFSEQEIADLNIRYGSPLKSSQDVSELYKLVGGQPFLTRRALDVLSSGQLSFAELMATADRDDGPFGDHLKRILIAVSQVPSVLESMRSSLASPDLKDDDGYHRLLAAGIVQLTSDNKIALRCDLYSKYLRAHLGG